MDPINRELRVEINRVANELRDHGSVVVIDDDMSLFKQLVFLLTVLHTVLGKVVTDC